MKVVDVSGKKVIELGSEINAQSGIEFKTEALTLFEEVDTVILSFGDVEYINSSGLRETVDLLKQSSKLKKNLKICCLNSEVQDMFNFTGLNKIFQIFDTLEEALV